MSLSVQRADVDTSDYEAAVDAEREERERFLAEHPRSPVADGTFAGLDYYPVDPAYRFELELDVRESPPSVTVETTTDGARDYLRWGEFRFAVDGETVSLSAFRSDRDDDRLWVPFRDETNGEKTYGAGRYLDLEADEHLTADGRWVVDFNRAYNPTCAYNHGYECPLVPLSNWLEVRIEAGERSYPGEPVDPTAQGRAGHDHDHDH
jgi:hypothetical protein